MATIIQGFEKQITEELVLKIAESPDDAERLAKFNAIIHEEELEEYVKRLYNEHPHRDEMLWFYIENVNEDKIVSSAALLPFKWKIRDTEFRVAELGFVGTLEEYRGQGLFGIIHDFYEEALKEHDYVLSVLVGIPYYYTRFGYVFALDRFNGYSMPTNNIPQEQIDDIKVRKATEDDLDIMKKLYDEHNQSYAVSTVFDKQSFQFRLMNTTCDIFNSITYIIEEDRKPRGYFTIGSLDEGNKADIILVSDLSYRQMIKTLQFVKTYNMGNITSFKVNVHPNTRFASYLKSKGADPITDWTWQVKIPDILTFFKTIAPVLEQRIENSMFRGLSQEFKFSNYMDIVTIKFEAGKIEDISLTKGYPSSEVDLRIPSPFHIRLFFSDRSVDELKHVVTDTLVKNSSKLLVETLFPSNPSIPFSWYE